MMGVPGCCYLKTRWSKGAAPPCGWQLPAWGGHDVVPKWLRKEMFCETSSSPPRKRKA